MQASCLPLRYPCNAANAYNSSIALTRAFVTPLNRNNGAEAAIQRSRSRQEHARSRRQPSATLSTTAYKGQESFHASPDVHTILQRDRRRLGGADSRVDHGRTNRSPRPAEANENGAETAALQEHSPSGNVFRKLPATSDSGERLPAKHSPSAPIRNTWQEHMLKIATLAGEFSQQQLKLDGSQAIIESQRKQLSYTGRYIPVPDSPMASQTPIPWALSPSERLGQRGSQLLHQEMVRFVEHMALTPAERAARESLISELLALIAKHAGSGVSMELFGSERTGLAMATSDIDIRLDCNVVKAREKWKYLTSTVERLAAALKKSNEYILVVSRNAKYPIVNAQHTKTGIDIQIVAAPSTSAQESVTMQYMAELPHLRSLYILLRAALGTRGLLDVFNGGIGSYGLLIMLVAGIKRRSSNPPVTLTEQLFRFLDFYTSLDTVKHGVSVSPSKLFKKHEVKAVPVKTFAKAANRRGDPVRAAQWAISQQRLFQPYLLCLQDPAKPGNDLGRKSNAIKHLTATLGSMKRGLAREMRQITAAANFRQPSGEESILLGLVGRCHEVNHERRAKVEQYGLKILFAREAGQAVGNGTGAANQVKQAVA